jgi:hypothetical protein
VSDVRGTAIVQVPIVKPTATDIDDEAMRWSLSWHPDGRCDSFTKEAILARAPPTSGVYGLFNFDCQVFIGESANIQEALLRHVSETDFQSRHLRATGFTFEPCTAELRKHMAAELIARFRPVLQTEAALTAMSSSDRPIVSDGRGHGQDLEAYADHLDFPVHEREKPAKARRRFHSKLTLGAAFAVLVASMAVIVYLGMPTDDDIQKQVNGAGKKSHARISITPSPTSGQVGIGSRPQKVSSIDAAGGRANQKTDGAVRFAATKASAADEAGVQTLLGPAKTIPTADSSGSANLSKKWSVQISAAPAKDIADHLVQQLIAKGYDGYMVRAELKGQTYYRVRVGHFAEREEAESMRQSLARQEGYRDAYLTGD